MARESAWNIATQLREEAAKAVGNVLSERSFLRPDSNDERRAADVLKAFVDDANRNQAFAGSAPLSDDERRKIVRHLLDVLFRMGPLQPFLDDPNVEELIVNGHDNAFIIMNGGRKERVEVSIAGDEELRSLMVRAASRFGRRLDEASPAVDVQLPSGRLHAVIPPLARYPCLTVRRHRLAASNLSELIELQTMGDDPARFLSSAVGCGLNILVSGGTATGKTTMLHALGREIPEFERVVTIEETAELQLDSVLADCVALEARFANMRGWVRSRSENSFGMPFECDHRGSSWARSAALRPSTCSRQ